MFKRILLSLLVGLLALAPTAVFAQSDLPPVFCGDLADDDCQLLEDSQAAMIEVSSSVVDSEVFFSVVNVAELPIKDATVTVNMHQVSYIDQQWAQDMRDLMMGAADAMQDDAEAFMQDYMNTATDMFTAMAFDLEVNVEMSDDLTEFLSGEAGIELPAQFSVDMRLIDGIMYFNVADLAAALDDPSIPTDWMGMDIATAMEQQQAQSEEAMADAMNELANPNDMAMMFALMNPTANEDIQALLEDVLTLERIEDDVVNDVDVAQFMASIDFAALLTNETFLELVFTQLESSGAMDSLGNMNVDEVAAMLQLVAPMLAQGVTIEQVQRIGIDDGYVYGSEFRMGWDLGTIMMLAQMGSGGRPARRLRADERPYLEFNIISESSDFNDAPEIVVPEDAQLIPLDSMQ